MNAVSAEKSLEQVVILGTGPAGLQAAIHAARKKVSVLVLGKHLHLVLGSSYLMGKLRIEREKKHERTDIQGCILRSP